MKFSVQTFELLIIIKEGLILYIISGGSHSPLSYPGKARTIFFQHMDHCPGGYCTAACTATTTPSATPHTASHSHYHHTIHPHGGPRIPPYSPDSSSSSEVRFRVLQLNIPTTKLIREKIS